MVLVEDSTIEILCAASGWIESAAAVVYESKSCPVLLAETAATRARFLPGIALAQAFRGVTPTAAYGTRAGIIGL